MARVTLAVIAGYLVNAALLAAGQLVAARVMGVTGAAATIPPGYLVANLCYSLAFAAAGGWLAAVIARQTLAGIGLGVLILMMGLASFFAFQSSEPAWYAFLRPILGAAAACAGGVLRVKRHPPKLRLT